MLRRLRVGAGWSQERLAERSAISANGVAALEAGRRTSPRLNTVGLLCDALGLDPEQRAALIAASRPASPTTADPTNEVNTATNPRMLDSASILRKAPAVEQPYDDSKFIGRDAERSALTEAWTRRTRVALLLGEAGVGKTTLANVFAAGVGAQCTTLRGRATPQQLGAYEAFIDPVRNALAGVRTLDGRIPDGMRDLGRMIPGLFDHQTELLVPSRSDPATERRMLFETVARLLASIGPTLLMLDDIHWADEGTLALLTFLASQSELSDLMILGTVRSTDLTPATAAALADLRRHCTVARLQIGGLTRGELASLMNMVAAGNVSESLIDTVTTATNGNPLFVKELTEHLLQRTEGRADQHSVPDGIRATIELRVSGLSTEAQSLLRGASVLGQRFEAGVAGHLVGLNGDALLGAVEDALVSGLLVERHATMSEFSHGLVATTVYESMSILRRVALHRNAASALADLGPRTTAEIVDVARHWGLVADGDVTARPVAASWALQAGDAAAASAAIDDAVAWYERTVALAGGPTVEHANALVRLGSALTASGRIADGNEHLERGLQCADAAGDPTAYAKAALGLAASVQYGTSDDQRIAQLESAIARFEPTEQVLRPALLATLKRQLGFVISDAAEQRRNEASAAVAAAVSASTASEELLISLGGLRDSLVVDDPIPLGQLAEKIITVATARQDLPVLSTGLYRLAWSAMELGQADRFRYAVHEYRRIAELLRRPYELALSSNMLAALASIEGRYADAESAGQEALAIASTIEDGNFSWVYFANSGLRAIDEGHVMETYEMMRAVRPDFKGMPTFEAALPAVAARAGEHAFACALIDEQLGKRGEILERDWMYLSAERLPVLGLLSWAASMANHVRQATLLRDSLLRHVELGVRVVRVAPVGAWIGPIDHHIGTLEHLLGNLDSAEHHLRRSLVVAEEMNGPTWKVRTLMALASVAETATSPASAMQWRAEANQLAATLELPALTEPAPY